MFACADNMLPFWSGIRGRTVLRMADFEGREPLVTDAQQHRRRLVFCCAALRRTERATTQGCERGRCAALRYGEQPLSTAARGADCCGRAAPSCVATGCAFCSTFSTAPAIAASPGISAEPVALSAEPVALSAEPVAPAPKHPAASAAGPITCGATADAALLRR